VNVLFVCSRNKLRSPTAEKVFSGIPGLEVDSGGLSEDAETPLSSDQVVLADIIFVMEKRHRALLTKRFGSRLRGKKIVCLDIPDKYQYMDPLLVSRLRVVVPKHIPADYSRHFGGAKDAAKP
jgi:predicted protein tyrosine phosphatase